MSVNYREPQWLLPNEKNLQYPAAGATQGSGLTADRHSLYSMYFNVDHRIDLGSSINLGVNSSISFWYKTSTNNNGSVVFGESTYSYEYLLQWGSAVNKIYFRIGSVVKDFTGITEIEDGNWHHYCIIRTGANAELFVDGASRGTVTGLPTGTNTLIDTIGATPSGTHTIDNSYLDEIAFWSRSLSSDEVTTLYNSGSPSNPMLLSGKPVAYYPLGEQARKPGTANWRFPNEVLQGQAINFDGSTDFIDVGVSPNSLVGSSNAYTVSSWVNPDISGNLNIIGSMDSGNRWYFRVLNGYASYAYGSAVGDNGYDTAALTGVSLNTWSHVMFTFDGSTTHKIYINGDLKLTQSSGSGQTITSTKDLYIGALNNNGTTQNYFNGSLSNVAIWNSDQSANVANIYNYGAPQTSYTVTPTAWYKLDKTSEYAGLNANWHNALDFNGSSNYLTIPSTNFAGSSGEVSYSFWLNPDTYTHPSSNDYGYIFSGAATSDGGIAISEGGTFAGTNGTVSAGKVYYWNGTNAIILTNALTENVWSHVVLVFDDSGSVKGYVNGVLSISASSITTPYKSTFQNIGKFWNSTHYLNGQFSNLAVFNQAISAGDVKYLYNGGTPQTNISFEPTSWWKLNNLAAGIQDSGSASVNATATDSPTVVTDSVAVDQWNFDNAAQAQTPNWSSALDFNGTTDYINCGDSDTLTFGNGTTDSPFTISAWFNADTLSGSQRFTIGKIDSGAEWLLQGRENSIWMNLYDSTSSLEYIKTYYGATINTNVWTNVIFTYDGSGETTGCKMYINGSLVSTSNTKTSGYVAMGNKSSDLKIGARSGKEFDGKISNVSIFNLELSSLQVKTIYNNGQPETDISLSPVSWWKLDNTTTGIQDSGSASNNGTNNGATEIQTNVWTPRLNAESDTLPTTALVSSDLQFNSAYSSFSLDFDGTNDYIDCTDISYFSGADRFSLSTWFKVNSTDDGLANRDIISKGTTSAGTTSFFIRKGKNTNLNKISLSFNEGTTNVSSTTQIQNGVWYHVAVVYKGYESSNSDRAKIYINGVDDTASYTNTIPTTLVSSTQPLRIGRWAGSATDFNGKIDETAVWNRALNQAEITSIYNNGYPKDITALAPINWWRLGENAYFDGTDFTIPNKISGAPNGTSANMTATDLVADAPGSYAAGLGSSLALDDRVGEAPLSTANSLSFNMTPVNRVSYPAGYVPTQADNVYSMAFDGTNYVSAANTFLNSASVCSISFWGKKSASNKELVVGGRIDISNGIWIQWYSDGNIYFSPRGSGAGSFSVSYAQSYDADWHHYVGVYDGTSASNCKLYLDGNLVATGTGTPPANLPSTTGDVFQIGALGTSHYTTGSIDEVAIFDYALTPRQIKQDIYNGTTSGKTADLNNISNLTAPVAWYRMGD